MQELRPLLAENAEELLREAAEAVPFAPGYRGSRRKKRERERLRVVRVRCFWGLAAMVPPIRPADRSVLPSN